MEANGTKTAARHGRLGQPAKIAIRTSLTPTLVPARVCGVTQAASSAGLGNHLPIDCMLTNSAGSDPHLAERNMQW